MLTNRNEQNEPSFGDLEDITIRESKSARIAPKKASNKMSILAGFHVRTKSDLPKGSELHVIQENSDNDGPPSLDYDQEAPVNSTHNKPYLAPTRLFDSN